MGATASLRSGRRKDGKAGKGAASQPVELTPAVCRRRRALLGSVEPQQFEALEPLRQFVDPSDAEEDLVFDRLGTEGANAFRIRAHGVGDMDGYLGEHSIELLGLGLVTGSTLSKRLFNIAQVSKPAAARRSGSTLAIAGPEAENPDAPLLPEEPSAPTARKAALTCYELLALHSLLRAGSLDELVELLFCVFDADGDDLVSVDDFADTVICYLDLLDVRGAVDGLEPMDSEEFRSLNPKDRSAAVRRLAIRVVGKYGGATDAAVEEFSKTATQLSAEEAAAGAISSANAARASGLAQNGDTSSTVGQQGGAAGANSKKSGKRPRTFCLCGGKKKPPASADSREKSTAGDDSDSDASSCFSSDAEAERRRKEKKKEQQQPLLKSESQSESQKKRRSFSWRRGKKDNSSAEAANAGPEKSAGGEGAAGGTQAETTTGQKAGKSAGDKKRRSFGCICCSSGKGKKSSQHDQLPAPLTYQQWKMWFDDTLGISGEEPWNETHPSNLPAQSGNMRRGGSGGFGETALQPMGSGHSASFAGNRGSSLQKDPVSAPSARKILTAGDDDNDSGVSDMSLRGM